MHTPHALRFPGGKACLAESERSDRKELDDFLQSSAFLCHVVSANTFSVTWFQPTLPRLFPSPCHNHEIWNANTSLPWPQTFVLQAHSLPHYLWPGVWGPVYPGWPGQDWLRNKECKGDKRSNISLIEIYLCLSGSGVVLNGACDNGMWVSES